MFAVFDSELKYDEYDELLFAFRLVATVTLPDDVLTKFLVYALLELTAAYMLGTGVTLLINCPICE